MGTLVMRAGTVAEKNQDKMKALEANIKKIKQNDKPKDATNPSKEESAEAKNTNDLQAEFKSLREAQNLGDALAKLLALLEKSLKILTGSMEKGGREAKESEPSAPKTRREKLCDEAQLRNEGEPGPKLQKLQDEKERKKADLERTMSGTNPEMSDEEKKETSALIAELKKDIEETKNMKRDLEKIAQELDETLKDADPQMKEKLGFHLSPDGLIPKKDGKLAEWFPEEARKGQAITIETLRKKMEEIKKENPKTQTENKNEIPTLIQKAQERLTRLYDAVEAKLIDRKKSTLTSIAYLKLQLNEPLSPEEQKAKKSWMDADRGQATGPVAWATGYTKAQRNQLAQEMELLLSLDKATDAIQALKARPLPDTRGESAESYKRKLGPTVEYRRQELAKIMKDVKDFDFSLVEKELAAAAKNAENTEEALKTAEALGLEGAKQAGGRIAGPVGEVLAAFTFRLGIATGRSLGGAIPDMTELMNETAKDVLSAVLIRGIEKVVSPQAIGGLIRQIPQGYREPLANMLQLLQKNGALKQVGEKAVEEEANRVYDTILACLLEKNSGKL